MKGGDGYGPIPQLRPADPCHGNGKSGYMDMDDMAIHDKTLKKGAAAAAVLPQRQTGDGGPRDARVKNKKKGRKA